ncbi:MAG: hypothetical protein AVDCRST_MAG73-608, partial [uncultured Thermomicrobiales bacterium]
AAGRVGHGGRLHRPPDQRQDPIPASPASPRRRPGQHLAEHPLRRPSRRNRRRGRQTGDSGFDRSRNDGRLRRRLHQPDLRPWARPDRPCAGICLHRRPAPCGPARRRLLRQRLVRARRSRRPAALVGPAVGGAPHRRRDRDGRSRRRVLPHRVARRVRRGNM